MVSLSSRTYIKLHAAFQLGLAVYLTTSREVVTDDELLYQDSHGRLRIAGIPAFEASRSPFAYCGMILVIFALFDLTLALKLPKINRMLAMARFVRSSSTANDATWGSAVRKLTDQFEELYRQLCIILMSIRFSVFSVVSTRIFLSPDEFWGAAVAPASIGGHTGKAGVGRLEIYMGPSLYVDRSSAGGLALDSVDELKYKVVLAYGVMEALFSGWVLLALYNEQVSATNSFLSQLRNARTQDGVRP